MLFRSTPFLEDDHKSSNARAPVKCDPNTPVCPWCQIPVITTAKQVANINGKSFRHDEGSVSKPPSSGVGATDNANSQSSEGGADMLNDDWVEVREANKSDNNLKLSEKAQKFMKGKTGKTIKSKIKNNIVDPSVRGTLQPIASSILMRLLYGARYARFDLLKAVARLASNVSYWSVDCDRRLMRLMAYVKSSLAKRLIGWVGDRLEDVMPHAYADADFAGCPRTLRSTSGAQIQIEGPHTRFPVCAQSKRQTAVANSTPDAELSAIAMLFRNMCVPAIDLWATLQPCPVTVFIHEDNAACISVLSTGKNPTMRYIGRTQGINIQLLHEFVGTVNPDCPCALVKTESDFMVADVHKIGRAHV